MNNKLNSISYLIYFCSGLLLVITVLNSPYVSDPIKRPEHKNPVINGITVTYYNLSGTTSCEEETRDGIVALSRDLYEVMKCGDMVHLRGIDFPLDGTYVVSDKMAAYKTKSVDVYSKNHFNKGKWKDISLEIIECQK